MDFKTIKTATRALAKTLDHRYLNDIPPFDTVNPTAENIAQYFYQSVGAVEECSTTIHDNSVSIVFVYNISASNNDTSRSTQ
jgi:6-pyruvoyl-tetrahydropterin synthase